MQIVAENIQELYHRIDENYSSIKFPVVVNFQRGDIRTSLQNRLQHKHYAEIDKFWHEQPGYAKRFCKYTFGLPILIPRIPSLARVEEIPDYEDKIDFMENINITSLFIKLEARDYTEAMMNYFPINGLRLTDPDDRLLAEWEKVYQELKSKGEL